MMKFWMLVIFIMSWTVTTFSASRDVKSQDWPGAVVSALASIFMALMVAAMLIALALGDPG